MASRSGTSDYGPRYSRLESNDAIVSRLAQDDKVPWYKKANLRFLYLLMFPTCVGAEMTTGFDATMLNGLQTVPSWVEYYHHPHSGWLGLMSAMYPLGALFALPFLPSIVDKHGRRYSIFIGSMLTITGGVLQGAAFNFTMFIIARFFLGFGNVFAIVAASSLVGELSHPKERAVMGAIFNIGWMVGSMIAAGATLATFSIPNNWGWRVPSFLQAVPSLFQVSFIWFLPESPRWLISMGRGDEAYIILVKYHAEGDQNSEFVKAEYSQIQQTLGEEMKKAQMSWKEVLSTTGMRRRVMIASFLAIFTKWSGNGMISYFLSPILDIIGIHDNRMKNIINFTKSGWELVNCIFFALTIPVYPRRRIYLICTISLSVVLVAWTMASAEYALTHSLLSSQAVLILIFLHSAAYSVGFNCLTFSYLVELFPFHVRARGISIFLWWNRCAGFVNQFVDPIGIDAAGWKYYIIYCIWSAFQVIFVYLMFPETYGRTLEELAFLFEGNHRQDVSRNAELEPLLHEQLQQAGTHDANSRDGSRVWQG